MGMAASQVRFLSLQNRKNTIGLNLMTLSNRKTALSRDMNRVATEYNNAMNQKVLKWSNDSGVTYRDIDYDTLMKPNDLNSTLPYIVTDAQGRVVIDDNNIILEGRDTGVSYRDLAMMISAYSGTNENTGFVEYKNLQNLQGGILSSAAIADASVTNKAESGIPNKKGYEIVALSNQMVSNTLRYDLMLKLGLIDEAERNEVLHLEKDIYGSTETTDGPYPVGTLMGDYYLAKAIYDVYENLMADGDFSFSAENKDKNGNTIASNTTNKKIYSLDGTDEIKYDNTTTSTGTNIIFNGVSANLDNVDLTKIYNSTSDTIEDLNKTDGSVNDYFKYTIDNGNISFNYGTPTMLTLMGTCDVKGNGNHDKFNDNQVLLVNGTGIKGQNWASLYNNNAVISLYDSHRSRGGDDVHSYNKKVAKDNLTILVTEMTNDFKNQDALTVDSAAAEKAKDSTIAFFLGEITNNGNSVNKDHGANHHSGTISRAASDRAMEHNLIGSANRDGSWIQGTDDYIVADVSFVNLYNTFITFYDYYYHSPDVDAITTGGTYTIPASETYVPVDTGKVSYKNPGTKFNSGGTQYIRLEGTETIELDDGSTKNVTYYDYYQTDALGNKTGALIQRDYLEQDEDGNEFITREFYDHANNGANAKQYTIDKSQYNTYMLQINTGTNPQALSCAETEVGASDGSLELSYTDDNGNVITYKLANKVTDSTYATTINADVADYLSQLQDKVNEAKAKLDEALNKLDIMFASKESKIMDYFDAIFKMIAENGWYYDENVNNPTKKENSKNYLNAKLQNNMYFITEVDTLDGQDFNYATKLAMNVSKVFQVYDTDAQNVALSKYESEKADITAKEKVIDIRMNKLEAEQDAISTELDSIKQIIKDNVDKTFKIFT